MKTKKPTTPLELALQAVDYAALDYQREFEVDKKVVKRAKDLLAKLKRLPTSVEAITKDTMRLIWGSYEFGVNANYKDFICVSSRGQFVFETAQDAADYVNESLEG